MINNDIVDLGFSWNMLLDKTEEEAAKLCEANGREWRVIERNNKPVHGLSKDVRPGRVGLCVVDGVVNSYKLG